MACASCTPLRVALNEALEQRDLLQRQNAYLTTGINNVVTFLIYEYHAPSLRRGLLIEQLWLRLTTTLDYAQAVQS